MKTIERLESGVRSYSRSWPTVFTKSKGHLIWNREGKQFIDFFSGAGSLNYGHNNDVLKRELLTYIENDNVTHSLDMATDAREKFLEKFEEVVLKPRGMDFVVQFPGPTGTNSVEAALKLARKWTGRELVIGFTNAFHGMTLGSLAVTGNESKRSGAGVPLYNAISMPYEDFLGEDTDTIEYLEAYIESGSSGMGLPAAVIVETVQGEGGVHTASFAWLRKLEALCHRHDILLILDDIQMGCGRTGTFFSFEPADIKPDIVCLSKSISGYGLPMALTIFRRDLDSWDPGEHNGTFRGHNPAFVTAARALDYYWKDDALARAVARKATTVESLLDRVVSRYASFGASRRGRGLAQGLLLEPEGMAEEVAAEAFERGLLMETSGAYSEVVKFLPPLTIPDEALEEGLGIMVDSLRTVADRNAAPVLAG
jgi:diaminobutyrate-2-oxoglutarate transaminase